jgi:hypothetical protein
MRDIPNNSCGGRKQSPIDLPMSVEKENMIEAKWDKFDKLY